LFKLLEIAGQKYWITFVIQLYAEECTVSTPDFNAKMNPANQLQNSTTQVIGRQLIKE